jgi:hypothetical protein
MLTGIPEILIKILKDVPASAAIINQRGAVLCANPFFERSFHPGSILQPLSSSAPQSEDEPDGDSIASGGYPPRHVAPFLFTS